MSSFVPELGQTSSVYSIPIECFSFLNPTNPSPPTFPQIHLGLPHMAEERVSTALPRRLSRLSTAMPSSWDPEHTRHQALHHKGGSPRLGVWDGSSRRCFGKWRQRAGKAPEQGMGDLRGLPVFHQRTGHTCDLGVKFSDSWQAGPNWSKLTLKLMSGKMDRGRYNQVASNQSRKSTVSGHFKTILKEYIWKELLVCGCMSADTKVHSEEKNWNKLLRTVQFNMPFRESFQNKYLVWLQTGSSRSI